MLSAEDELNSFLKEIQKGKDQQNELQSITYDAIAKNAAKAYDEIQDVGQLIQDHKDNTELINREMMMQGALVHVKNN